jgi:hypothetical protein
MKTRKSHWIFTILMFLATGIIVLCVPGCSKESTGEDPNPNPPDDTTTNVEIPAGWSKVGDLNANNMIWSLVTDESGNLYAAGYFTNAGGFNYVAKWNGTSWSDLGNLKANSGIFALAVDAENNVYATGQFTNGITPDGGQAYVARWNGTAWSDIGGGGGTFLSSDAVGNIYKGMEKWNGSSWNTLCPLCTLNITSTLALVSNPSGSVIYAGGNFQHPNGARYVAACDASNCWNEIGSLNANGNIEALGLDSKGNLYAAGDFTNGALPSTGSYFVARWDGSAWSELGNLNANGDIYFMAVDPVNDFVYVSGYFHNTNGNSYVAKWDGSSWSDLGNMMLAPAPIHVSAAGKLYSVVASSNGQQKFTVVVKD